MAYLLFHGRHILNTSFQEKYLWQILNLPFSKLDFIGPNNFNPDERIDTVVFAVTSSNKSNSRFNPLPFYIRAISLDRFFEHFRKDLGIKQKIVGIPHFDPTDKYIEIILKEIHESDGLELTPKNTIVLASTPNVIDMYISLGFTVLPAEYDYQNKKFIAQAPIDALHTLAEEKVDWQKDTILENLVSTSTFSFWKDFPSVPDSIKKIWKEPLLTDSGSLTETRNYSTYASAMARSEVLDMKYLDIKKAVVSGKIVDEGCADGALMVKLAYDFPDSDIIGIDIASEFLARCTERQRAGEFGGAFVHFHQRNLMDSIFEDGSIDTTICNSTTHEVWSYGDGLESLKNYINLKYKQTRKGGRLVIRDVVGPENKDKEVYLKLNSTDGTNENIFFQTDSQDDLMKHINSLSTEAKFFRFAKDYLEDMRTSGRRGKETKINFKEENIDGQKYFVLRMKDAVEFITKKDYADNWKSELNEEFAFFSFSDWKDLLHQAGFDILENPNKIETASRVYTNDWIVQNRFVGKVEIFENQNGILKQIQYPPTNMVLVAQKSF
ncbi:MAG: methyltransferase domain-containing protein [Candidatus Nomurabacteria bacterium]|nr:methyltransferase domain-containing protein [Candidatus Nomurabacteria bacterium]